MKFYTHILGGIVLGIFIMFLINKPVNLKFLIVLSLSAVIIDLIDMIFFKKHDRFSHSLMIIIIPLLIFKLNYTIALAILIGFLSHLFLDIVTTNGCPLFYPFSKTYICFNEYHPIKTGTKNEKALAAFFIVLLMIIFTIQFSLIDDIEKATSEENSYTNNFKANINLNIEDNEKELTSYTEDNISKIRIVNIDSQSEY